MNKKTIKKILMAAALLMLNILIGCASSNSVTKNAIHTAQTKNQYYPYLKSLIYLNEGKIDLAISEATQSYHIKQSPEMLVYISKLMLLKDKYAAANTALYTYKKYPKNRNIVALLLNKNMPISVDKKIEIAKRYLKNRNDNKIRMILAKLYAQKHQLSKSISELSKIKTKNNPKILISKGEIYLSLGMKSRSEKLFKKAYKQDNSNVKLGLFLARIEEEKGNIAGAIKFYKKIAATEPDNMLLLYHIAQDLERLDRDKEALHYYNTILYYGHLLRKQAAFSAGLIYLKLKNFKKAEKLFETLSKANKTSYAVNYYLALAKKALGKLQSAYTLFSKINIVSNFYADSIVNMAEIKSSLNKTAEGLKLIDRALKLKPESIELKIEKADFLKILKRYDEAISLYMKLANSKLDNNRKQYLYLDIADIEYENKHNTKKAITFLKKAISLNPKNAEAMNYLGYIYIDRDIDIQKGIRLVKKALTIYPENRFYQDSLGWGYYKLGLYKKALKILKKASTINDPIIFKHLGFVYKKLKNYKKAHKFFLKSYHKKDDKSVYRQLILLRRLIEKK